MTLKVVHTFALEGVDRGERLPASVDVSPIKGMWRTEDEIIKNAQDADAVIGVVPIHPFSQRMLATNPLTKMANIILTGHNTFYSVTSESELYVKPMAQVVMALRGEWPTYAINPEVKKKWMGKWGEKD